jgi:hypothetical protein
MQTCSVVQTVTLPPERERWCVGCVEPGLKQVLGVLILVAKELQEDCVHVLRCKFLQEIHRDHVQRWVNFEWA